MPLAIHEWVVAPLALGLALRHAARALGLRRALVELAALTGYGFALEWVAMAVFRSHRYSADWVLAPAGVPLAIAAVWAAILSTAMALAVRAGARSAVHRAALAASIGIALDLLMEPVATRLGLWEWTPHGPWLSVPIGNFVGWAVIVGGYTFAAERWAGNGPLIVEAARRAGLAVAAIAALVGVGLFWTRSGAERLFDDGRGWIAWAALLAAGPLLSRALFLARRSDDARGSIAAPRATLAERLGTTPGPVPLLVFVVIGLAFAADAARLGGVDLALVTAGAAASLGLTLRRSATPPAMSRAA
jgi:uncharacterized membrane protein